MDRTTRAEPGPEQRKLDSAAGVALHALVTRNEKLTTALSEVIMHLSNANVIAAKQTAEDALHDL